MIHGIDHTAISVADLQAALAFYCEVLGFELESQTAWAQGAKRIDRLVGLEDSASKVAMVRLGTSRIEIFEYECPEPRPRDPALRVCDHGITHICLDVTGIYSEYERLGLAGVEFNDEPLDVGTSIAAYGRDPFGNVLELREMKTAEPI